MPLLAANLKKFQIQGRFVHLDPNYLQNDKWKFKKITGTRLASVLGQNKYNSPFKVWMEMVNLYKETMDPTLALVGNVIEPKIRDYVSHKFNLQFYIHNPIVIKFDIFKNNKIFGGIPDGEPLNANNEIDYSNGAPMLEIKTSSIDAFHYKKECNELRMQKDNQGIPLIKEKGSKKAKWFNDNKICIPVEYRMQLALYLYLRNTTHGIFAIGFLESIDYVNPEHFIANERDIRVVEFNINRTKFEPFIHQAEKWYMQHIETGISPAMTNEDYAWLQSELKRLN